MNRYRPTRAHWRKLAPPQEPGSRYARGTVVNIDDDAGRLTSVTNKNSGNTTLSSFSYSYNNDNPLRANME